MSANNTTGSVTTTNSNSVAGGLFPPNVTVSPNGLVSSSTISFPNSSGSFSIGSTSPWTISTNDSYYNTFDFEEKVLDLEKMSKLDTIKREMIMELFVSFTKCEDYNTKKLILNTLEVYNVITDQKALTRKMKISKITDNGENIK